ncbi:MAG: S53 family peptidase [Solirubrobacteraceae bacterium]
MEDHTNTTNNTDPKQQRRRRRPGVLACSILALVGIGGSVALAMSGAGATAELSGAGLHEARATQVWMTVRQEAAQHFVDASSKPDSKSFRHFLSPEVYTKRFGPSAAQLKAVESYLTRQHFTHVFASVNDDYVSGFAPASDHVTLKIPAALSHDVLAVTGRNDTQAKVNISAARQRTTTKSFIESAVGHSPAVGASDCARYWGQKTVPISPPFHGVTVATRPVCGYSASEIRRAYGLSATDTGAGVTIALIQEGGPVAMRRILTTYARRNGLPAPKPGQYREQAVGGGARNSRCLDVGAPEAELDSQAAYAMAPAARQLMVDGDDCDTNDGYSQALLDAMLTPLTGHGPRPSAAIESVSWNMNTTPGLLRAEHAVALRAAAEGVSLMVASGDSLGFFNTAQDPDITAVGGTTLGLGADGRRLFETGWSTGSAERVGTSGAWIGSGVLNGSGGGVSPVYSEPGYQRGVVPRAMATAKNGRRGRVMPDISADGDFATALLVAGIDPKTGRYTASVDSGGTSQATPLVAGMVADAEYGQPGGFGFLNPLLYPLSGSEAIADVLPLSRSAPPVQRAFYRSGTTYIDGKYGRGFLLGVTGSPAKTGRVTTPGYDTLTGIGTPNGSAFINALRAGR